MIVYVKIISPLEYQVFDDYEEGLIPMEESDIEEIGKTKQFDINTNALIPYIPGIEKKSYSELVNNYIRERYTVDQELAILRQRDSKFEEFQNYNNYCENCKIRAKKELGII